MKCAAILRAGSLIAQAKSWYSSLRQDFETRTGYLVVPATQFYSAYLLICDCLKCHISRPPGADPRFQHSIYDGATCNPYNPVFTCGDFQVQGAAHLFPSRLVPGEAKDVIVVESQLVSVA
ncbi:hypothetical protein BDN71DRAFT_1508772 [Pleurotus eryngii]|uniref:Uncharacterized protein n=1 Tax=Pleurotus eryngii TaxID=5323 RepID=A0A9P5ZVN9_PLEER|nr:hypothetical protein BDN71DRAFT_1508772 [Pleurotus eryngii]